MEEEKLPAIMECSAGYTMMEDDSRDEIAHGSANLILDAEKLTLLPLSGETLSIPYRDIIQIAQANYRIDVRLVAKEQLTIFDLGHKYEDFFRNFSYLNNEVILKDLLMNETIIKTWAEAQFNYIDENITVKAPILCELRLYETGIVIISEKGDFIRIPYSDIASIQLDNYQIILNTEREESYVFSKMGKELNNCYQMLNDGLNKLAQKTQVLLKELFPGYDSSVIRKAGRVMKEGRAVRRIDIEAFAPGLWDELERKLDAFGLKDKYEFLKSISRVDRICIGIKRGLMGDLTGEYIWFLVPIFYADHTQPGNAIAMEASIGNGGSKATYFFKIMERNQYLSLRNLEEMQSIADGVIKSINSNLVTVNFRREPIYLTDEQLNSSTYIGYRRSIAKVPALQQLRRLFIGRVIHRSPEQWQAGVKQLLVSNMTTV